MGHVIQGINTRQMKILFIIYHGLSAESGVSKKILNQVTGFRELGHEVFLCCYNVDDKNQRLLTINRQIIHNFGSGRKGALYKRFNYKKLADFAINNKIDFVYTRSFHNANPFTISLFKAFNKANIKSAIEIPTYPYDQEYKGFPLCTRIGIWIDKIYRKKLASLTNAIVTFTDDKIIFDQKTIRISNGIDFNYIPLMNKKSHNSDEIHFIGVAEVHYWHGYDRIIEGIGKYYEEKHTKDIYFHIVGGVGPSEMYNSIHAKGFHELIEKYNIEQHIIFHGQKFGKDLDDIFDNADFAIGSLGRHRSGITNIKTLKNREYAARGIPFIYSEIDSDFDNKPYILKAKADDSYIDINTIIKFYKSNKNTPIEIRNSILNLSWKNQMKIVIKAISEL